MDTSLFWQFVKVFQCYRAARIRGALRIFASSATGFLVYLADIVGHFLLASLSHPVRLTHEITCVQMVSRNRFFRTQGESTEKTRAKRNS